MSKTLMMSRIISKAATKKAINKLLVKPKKIQEKKALDWTMPKEERENHIKRSWLTKK